MWRHHVDHIIKKWGGDRDGRKQFSTSYIYTFGDGPADDSVYQGESTRTSQGYIPVHYQKS